MDTHIMTPIYRTLTHTRTLPLLREEMFNNSHVLINDMVHALKEGG